jgi:hypothetical protein
MSTDAILSQFGSATGITITLGSLASGSARQGTIVDNTGTKFPRVLLAASVKLGTSPTANTLVSLYLLRDDTGSGPIRTDGAGASDAAITVLNAQLIGTLRSGGSPSTGDVLSDVFAVDEPGPKWTVAALNGTGVALDATNGNHTIEFIGVNPQLQ